MIPLGNMYLWIITVYLGLIWRDMHVCLVNDTETHPSVGFLPAFSQHCYILFLHVTLPKSPCNSDFVYTHVHVLGVEPGTSHVLRCELNK